MPGASAQEDVTTAPAEPVVIEIIGDAPSAPSGDTAKTAPAKTPDEPAASDLAPVSEQPLAATAATAGSGSGAGAGSTAPLEKVDPFVGSFSTAVPIEIPPFHGIAPNLTLTYNSSRGNGFVGVGWELSGLSVIERASPGKGAPRHDATDIYLLDGQELITCVVGTVSPGCDTGGTHATKVESYLRITQDATGNSWEIWGRDGTKTTYTAVMGSDTLTALGTYRWAMTSVADTHGNTVTYNWWCDGAPAVACYPDTITYNLATVRFHREVRPDAVTSATGSLLGHANHRLKTVDVHVGLDRARVYALSYSQSSVTGQSTLASVQPFGRDAIVDAAGVVTGGATMPPIQAMYSLEPPGTFTSVFWANWCTGYEVQFGDFNGDGKTDMQCHRTLSDADNWVAFSNGDGTFTSVRTGNWCRNHEVQFGDFNGDGKTDLQCHKPATAENYVAFSNGDGTFTSVFWANWCTGHEVQFGDFNGDGKTDLQCHKPATAENYVAFSNGDGTFTSVRWDNWCTGYEVQLGDFNGDGKTDMQCHKTLLDAQNYVAFSNGDGTFTSVRSDNWCRDHELQFGDFNGDGKTDLQCHKPAAAVNYVAFSNGAAFPVVTAVQTPLGGITTVEYTPSSAWTNQNLPMVLQTVSSLTTDDGRGNTSTTSYAYEGGLWDAEERRFLGFRKATVTLPCIAGETACPYTESTFRQDRASAGRVAQIDRFDGAGTLLTRALEEYVVNDTTAPYTALNTGSESLLFDGLVTRRTRVTRGFDAYANVVEETGHGDADLLGDEITAATDYAPNTAAYIVALPARMRGFEGIGTTGALLTESQIHYDGATAWATPPIRGDPTETREWLDAQARFVAASAEYDAFGNVTATIDPLGRRGEVDYDPVHHLYPVAARNPLYFPPTSDLRHQTSTVWDPVCGVPTASTDLNGNTTTTQYDALCRPTRTDLPDGGFAITSYNSLGTPTAQYVETQTPPADGSGNIWGRRYFDGHGRTYRAIAKGSTVGQEIQADITYNARGLIASGTAPYYAGNPFHTTIFDYDALDRPTGTTHPDGNWVETRYGVDGVFESITSYDELGQPVTLHLDAYGNVVRQEEPLDASTTIVSTFAWDRLGQLTGITDDAGNQWTYTLDSFGRVTTINDPDLGIWTKTFDDADRLTTQTDALGQVTRFTYDAVGRLLTKTARDGTPQADVTTYAYDEAVAGFHNTGQLTRAQNAAGTLRYRYDTAGREVQRIYTIDGSDYAIATGFDIAGRPIRVDYPDGDSVGSALDPISYDAAGRLTAIPASSPARRMTPWATPPA